MLGGEIEDRYEPLGIRLEWPCGAFGGPTYNWFRNGVRIPRRYIVKLTLVHEDLSSLIDIICAYTCAHVQRRF